MYKLIIFHDDGKVEVAAQGTLQEVNQAIPAVIAAIDPDTAVWQLKWQPNPVVGIEQYVGSQMGNFVNGY